MTDATEAAETETRHAHIFQPIVSVTEREDGRYDVEFDWSDSYQHSYDVDSPAGDPLDLGPEGTPGDAAADAMDVWIKRNNGKFIIDPGRVQTEERARDLIDGDRYRHSGDQSDGWRVVVKTETGDACRIVYRQLGGWVNDDEVVDGDEVVDVSRLRA